MQAAEYIAFARKLLAIPAAQCPAGYRSVTSRLYYGAYHMAMAFVEDELGFQHRKSDDNENKHKFVIEYLSGSNEIHAQDLAALLNQLHDRRKCVDYKLLNVQFDKEDFAIESVNRVDRILNSLDACREDSVQGRIKAGMAAYRQRRGSHSSGTT